MNNQKVMDYQRKRLITLIREVDALYDGNDEAFLQEYIAEVLKQWSNNMQEAINCFEGLKVSAFPHHFRAETPRKWKRLKGHGAFYDNK